MTPPSAERPDQVLARARAEFRGRFGRDPEFAARAPGRVNLIGEHTDYTGGFVLPIAIDRVCVAVGGPAADPALSRLATADLNEEARIALPSWVARPSDGLPLAAGEPLPDGISPGSWPSYIAGVAAEFFARAPAVVRNIDLAIASSVPVGSGLSSSAAIEVATATLLEAITGVALDPREKALLCQRAEHRYAGVPCGIMDQLISVMGRENHALLIDCRSQETTLVPMPPPSEAVLLIIDTGIRHALASGEYARRRAACEAAAARLGKPLRDATSADLARFTPADSLLPIARHVVTENRRTLAAADALRAGDLPRLGRLMLESHASLRDDYRVSCEELDTVVGAARAMPGVFGARMTGGGFGGCAIALVATAEAAACAPGLIAAYERRFARCGGVQRTQASTGALIRPFRR